MASDQQHPAPLGRLIVASVAAALAILLTMKAHSPDDGDARNPVPGFTTDTLGDRVLVDTGTSARPDALATDADAADDLAGLVRLQNECESGYRSDNCKCRGKFLDIDAETGRVIMSDRGSGTFWTLNAVDPTLVTLANQGGSAFKGLLLDIDGQSGRVILSQKGSGTQWRRVSPEDGLWSFRNEGTSSFKGYYLDIDGQTCTVMLGKRQGSGTFWRLEAAGGTSP